MNYILLFLFITLAACSSKTKADEPTYVPVNLPKEAQPIKAGYYCPMKCEGDKVYTKDHMHCPVCDMKLIHTK